jgi:hypothetical protein
MVHTWSYILEEIFILSYSVKEWQITNTDLVARLDACYLQEIDIYFLAFMDEQSFLN